MKGYHNSQCRNAGPRATGATGGANGRRCFVHEEAGLEVWFNIVSPKCEDQEVESFRACDGPIEESTLRSPNRGTQILTLRGTRRLARCLCLCLCITKKGKCYVGFASRSGVTAKCMHGRFTMDPQASILVYIYICRHLD